MHSTPTGKTLSVGVALLLTGILVALLMGASGNTLAENEISGRPVRILSGERLILLGNDGHRYLIKLAGIAVHPPDQRWGAAAKRQLESLIMGHSLIVRYTSVLAGGELLGFLYHGGADINIRLLQAGLAQFAPHGISGDKARRYAEAEQKARQASLGAWGEGSRRTTPGYRTIPGGPLFRIEK